MKIDLHDLKIKAAKVTLLGFGLLGLAGPLLLVIVLGAKYIL